MKQRLQQFMYGRNGNDSLNAFLLAAALVLCGISMIFRKSVGPFLSWLVIALLAWSYFRMFSKKLYKRRAENEKFLRAKYAAESKLRLQKEKWNQRKDYRFFACPSCKSTMRVPKNRGKIVIVCRKCGTSFTRKT